VPLRLSHQHRDSPMDVVLKARQSSGPSQDWHRSMPLQRCNTKITGLCKTLHLMSVPIWSPLQLRNYADPHFRAAGYNAILAYSSRRRFEDRVRILIVRARCTPLPKTRRDPSAHTH
jgi:hypothetical protein